MTVDISVFVLRAAAPPNPARDTNRHDHESSSMAVGIRQFAGGFRGGGFGRYGILAAAVGILSVALLAVLGALGAKAGGANIFKGAIRVTFCGTIAMAGTAGIGALFGTRI